MATLTDIKAAVDALPPEQQQELFLFLAARLRVGSNRLPVPREFSSEQMNAWIIDDEESMRQFQARCLKNGPQEVG